MNRFGASLVAMSNDCGSIGVGDACEEPFFRAQPGWVYIVIDGDNGAQGAYDLTISGTYYAGERCDAEQIAAGIMTCERFTTCVDGTCQY